MTDGALIVAAPAAQAEALNDDGTANSARNPAAPGSLVTVFATGLGQLNDAAPEQDFGEE